MEALLKLGIDWQSILIYIVNIGILFGVIAYFVTGPILKILDGRRKQIRDNLEAAERIKNEFVAERKKADEDKKALRAELDRELTLLKKDLEEKRRIGEEALNVKKAKMLEEVRTLVEDEKGKILKTAETEALKLIENVILNIVSEKLPRTVVEESVRDAWKQFSPHA